MKTKNIFKTLAFVMLMPAILLTTACNSDFINDEGADQKGFTLPVTVNVTRQGDDPATKAEYNKNGDNKLEFSKGDKLFVYGDDYDVAGYFAGMLDYDASEGNFSGTIYTENSYSGTADALFTAANFNGVGAVLFPAGYETYEFLSISGSGYSTSYSMSYNKAIASSKATAVEQFSCEMADTYSSGFALSPQNAILNFTISGLAHSTEVTATLKYGSFGLFADLVSGSVTTDGSGNATFAMAIAGDIKINQLTLTIGGNDITFTSSDVSLVAGKIYNITRNAIPGALIGQFSVSSTKKVYFSKGNLQYTKSTGIWSFMDHQYSTVETASQNVGTDYDSQDVVSLFGWGTSGWDNGNTYYQPYNTSSISSSYGYGYGPKNGTTYTYDLTGTYANADWGLYNAISNGGNTAGTWRTLTKDEWTYLFNTRSASTVNGTENARYAKAYLFGTTHGVIIFPDSYTHPAGVTAPTGINATSSTSWDGNRYTATDWAKMEAAGCVFLPAAGWRDATTIRRVNEYVRYWTSTYYSASLAHNVGITNSNMNPADYNQKSYGYSVRLVHDAN